MERKTEVDRDGEKREEKWVTVEEETEKLCEFWSDDEQEEAWSEPEGENSEILTSEEVWSDGDEAKDGVTAASPLSSPSPSSEPPAIATDARLSVSSAAIARSAFVTRPSYLGILSEEMTKALGTAAEANKKLSDICEQAKAFYDRAYNVLESRENRGGGSGRPTRESVQRPTIGEARNVGIETGSSTSSPSLLPLPPASIPFVPSTRTSSFSQKKPKTVGTVKSLLKASQKALEKLRERSAELSMATHGLMMALTEDIQNGQVPPIHVNRAILYGMSEFPRCPTCGKTKEERDFSCVSRMADFIHEEVGQGERATIVQESEKAEETDEEDEEGAFDEEDEEEEGEEEDGDEER